MTWDLFKLGTDTSANDGRFVVLLLQSFLNGSLLDELKTFIGTPDFKFETAAGLLRQHGLLPLCYWLIRQADYEQIELRLPETAQTALRNYYHGCVAENMRTQAQLKVILDFTADRNIEIVPIKGSAFLCDLYNDFPFRLMSDIDVLVREEQLPLLESALLALGYKKDLEGLSEHYWRTYQYHLMFDPSERALKRIEAHFRLDYQRGVPLLPHLWQRLAQRVAQGHTWRVLSPEDALCSLALHWRHMGYNLNLKNVLDAALIVRKYPALDWEYLLREARAGRFCSALYFLMFQVAAFTESSIPATFMQGLRVPWYRRRLIERFVLRNTMRPCPPGAVRWLFLRSHLILYDSCLEPVLYIITIPWEQFAKFFHLPAGWMRRRASL